MGWQGHAAPFHAKKKMPAVPPTPDLFHFGPMRRTTRPLLSQSGDAEHVTSQLHCQSRLLPCILGAERDAPLPPLGAILVGMYMRTCTPRAHQSGHLNPSNGSMFPIPVGTLAGLPVAHCESM